VLNDIYVSHPTWASEEAGFVVNKKNSFEEAFHRCEEERHEYRVQLEALARTINLLEAINVRIDEMTAEERMQFKLKEDFGGPGRGIYHRIVKKIYGKDGGYEIIQALQDCPSVAVPVVLARLKQKDEDWRRAEREWRRTWREVDSKNFFKSLDQQGISFKTNDKKNVTAKHFVTEIDAVKNKQATQREKDGVPSCTRGSVGHQLQYIMEDTAVLQDALKLVYSFLDRSQIQYTAAERKSVEKFLRSFVPLLYQFPTAEFSEEDIVVHDDDLFDSSGRRSAGSSQSMQTNGLAASDLRIRLLKAAQERRGSAESRAASPVPKPLPVADLADQWIEETSLSSGDEIRLMDQDRPFFANTTFYTLMRLIQVSAISVSFGSRQVF
jgi:paired amphipathic helix protein Sin3a